MNQRDRIDVWRMRQIIKGRATHRDVFQLDDPTERELAYEEAEIADYANRSTSTWGTPLAAGLPQRKPRRGR